MFVGGPPEYVVVTSLWAFRRNELTVEFSKKWMAESVGKDFHDASGLPVALLDTPNPDLRVKVLSRPKPAASADYHLTPYCVQPLPRPFYLSKDPHGLGFHEAQMGRAKVVHLGTLRGQGTTLSERREGRPQEISPCGPVPALLRHARKACGTTPGDGCGSQPRQTHVQDRFDQVRVVARRDDLPRAAERSGAPRARRGRRRPTLRVLGSGPEPLAWTRTSCRWSRRTNPTKRRTGGSPSMASAAASGA